MHSSKTPVPQLPERISFQPSMHLQISPYRRALQRTKRPAEAGRLFLISCRRACRLGRDSVSVGRVFDLGFDPVGRAFGLDFDSADRAWAGSGLSSCFLSSWRTED